MPSGIAIDVLDMSLVLPIVSSALLVCGAILTKAVAIRYGDVALSIVLASAAAIAMVSIPFAKSAVAVIPHILVQVSLYVNTLALAALVVIGIAVVVKGLGMAKPVHNVILAVGGLLYTLGLTYESSLILADLLLITPSPGELGTKALIYTASASFTMVTVSGVLTLIASLFMLVSSVATVFAKQKQKSSSTRQESQTS